jgi:hypothetical protein
MQDVIYEQLLKYLSVHLQALFAQVKQYKEKKMKKIDNMQVTAVKFEDSLIEKLKAMLYAMRCLMQRMLINDEIYVKTLLNNDVEINVMSENLVARV